jgi:hypothetical protein
MTDKPVVVGMIASNLQDTNYTVAVPSHLLAAALSSTLAQWPDFEDIPTLLGLIESGEARGEEALNWDQYQISPPSSGE